MSRSRRIHPAWAVAALTVVAIAWISTPSFSALVVEDEPQALVAIGEELGECFADGWTPPANEVQELSSAAKPCRPCQDRPWCGCTYNGARRISCDPCCYEHPFTGDIICFD